MTDLPAEPDADAELADLLADLADDYRLRLSRGEDPDPEEYAVRFPHVAAEIKGALNVLRLTPIASSDPSDEGPPATLGDFRIVRELARGGMGVVYEAEQLSLGRRVALKVLPFAAVIEPRLRKRFENEARAAAALDHPHIVKVFGVGRDRDVHFLAMQFVDGCSLASVIRDGPLSADPSGVVRRVAELGTQAADALEYAHCLGIVHRDVKPGNLLLDKAGKLLVSDFGLAKVAAADASLTATGDVFGTLRYMSPEQAQARHDLVDHRTDVYSLGATLYELLTGRPAVIGTEKAEILHAVLELDPVRLRKQNPAVPRDLETIVDVCLRKDPAERYASARELADDLRAFLAGEPIRRRPLGRIQRVWRQAARRPALVGTVAAFLLTTILAAGLGLFAAYRGARLEAMDADRLRLKADQERVEQELEATAQREALQRFHAGLERVRQRRADPQAGWTRENLTDIRERARLGPAPGVQLELRSEAAAALGAIDLIQVGVLGAGRPAYGVDFSPDGRWIAVGDWKPDLFAGCHVRLYDARTHVQADDLVVRPDPGLADHLLKVGFQNGVREVRFSPAPGRWLAAGLIDARVVRWPTADLGAAPNRKIEPWWSADHRGDAGKAEHTSVGRIGFLPDGRWLVSASAFATRRWPIGPGGAVGPSELIAVWLMSEPSGLMPEVLVASWAGDKSSIGHYHWLDLTTGKLWDSGVSFPGIAAIGPPGRLAGQIADEQFSLIGVYPNATPVTVTTGMGSPLSLRPVARLQFSPTGGFLAVRLEHGHQVFVVDVATARLAAQTATTGDISGARFSPDGHRLALTTFDGTLLFNVTGGIQDTVATVNERTLDMIAAPRDHSKLMAAAHDGKSAPRVYRWDLTPGTAPALVKDDDAGLVSWGFEAAADYEPSGSRYFYVGDVRWKPPALNNVIDISDTARHGAGKFRAGAWSPDGNLWMVCTNQLHRFDDVFRFTALFWTNDAASENGGVVVRSMAAGKQFVLMGRRDGRLFRVATSNKAVESWQVTAGAIDAVDIPFDADRPDEQKQAVVGDDQGHIILVDVGSGKATTLPIAHRAPVRSVSCGPGFFASGSADGTVRLWFADGRPLAILRMSGPVRKVLLSADGKSLLVHVDGERGIRRWRLDRLFAAWRELGLGAGLPDN